MLYPLRHVKSARGILGGVRTTKMRLMHLIRAVGTTAMFRAQAVLNHQVSLTKSLQHRHAASDVAQYDDHLIDWEADDNHIIPKWSVINDKEKRW